MSVLHIDEVCPKGSSYPLIVNFQNGYTANEFNPNEFSLFEDTKTKEKTVATTISNLVYAGKEQKEESGKTWIIARNKKTGKVRLIEVGTAEMKPVPKNDLDETTVVDTSRLELSRKFGSKKQKRVMEQREKLKIDTETVSDQMHNVTVNITEDQVDISQYLKTESDDLYIPPIDRAAKKVDDVYHKHKILSSDQYDKILSEIKDKDYTSELLPWINNLTALKSNTENEYTVLALYASCLVKLYFTMTKEITKKNYTVCQNSAMLNNIILVNFTTFSNNRRSRSIQLKDKAMCHAMVFVLILNNFKYDAEELSANFKISLKTLGNKIRVIGASMVTNDNKKVVQLKLPLSTSSFIRRKSAKF
ncbi:uncharacterized protein LOC113512696 [Galleria mellonella]|uniref:Uncharacterized protein LOC113512696 n=1 Tax=Galleria mellonella TaxID=7137 RepID=A0A6J1WFY3_GALME|nr:uncharacterized protein LOC113512696 [Galleria mellonella]